jgi:hypothetical protein
MIKVPNMIMIGSAGRNTGKTELACKIIGRFKHKTDVYGIKVTTILQRAGQRDGQEALCPRGGKGCGVCTSLEGNYSITEENDCLQSVVGVAGKSGKDTARMAEAGAKKVYWLRVLKGHLKEGIEKILSSVDNNGLIVCESNSLRLIVEPGLFFITMEKLSGPVKASCSAVMDKADRIVMLNSRETEKCINHIQFKNSIVTLEE